MIARVSLLVLLVAVAGAAAVLSFDALRALALLVGYPPELAWMYPVLLDAGAAAGSVAWLSRPAGPARTFGRRLALALLGASVGGNAVGHVLTAYTWTAPWWLVVAASGVAPAVLAAVVHLVVLTAQDRTAGAVVAQDGPAARAQGDGPDPAPADRPIVDPVAEPAGDPTSVPTPAPADPATELADSVGPAAALVAQGAGRRVLARQLGISEYEARRVIRAHRGDPPPGPAPAAVNGHPIGTGAGR